MKNILLEMLCALFNSDGDEYEPCRPAQSQSTALAKRGKGYGEYEAELTARNSAFNAAVEHGNQVNRMTAQAQREFKQMYGRNPNAREWELIDPEIQRRARRR